MFLTVPVDCFAIFPCLTDLLFYLHSFIPGLTLTESWTSSNVLGGEVELADSLAKGLKLTLSGSLAAAASLSKQAKVGVEYKQEYLFANTSVDVFKGPTVSADVAVG